MLHQRAQKTIHTLRFAAVGSTEAAECTTWSAMDIDDWARPSRRPIFDTSRKTNSWHVSSSGTAARQEADCRTSTVTQAKPWNRWVLMPATCAATGICSIKPYLAQCAVLTTHHHGRCGMSASSALKRSKTSRGGVTAACRQASGTWQSDHGLGSALSEFGYLQVPPSLPAASQSRPPSCSLAAFSACGGELGGPRATARFVAHARLLYLSG